MDKGTGENICPTCGGTHDTIEKAEKGEIKKVAKSLVPYNVVKQYEAEFRNDFGKTIGNMGNDLMKKLNSYVTVTGK